MINEESKLFFESQAPVPSVVDEKPEEIDNADDLVSSLCSCVCSTHFDQWGVTHSFRDMLSNTREQYNLTIKMLDNPYKSTSGIKGKLVGHLLKTRTLL